jgi:hypothetical protein
MIDRIYALALVSAMSLAAPAFAQDASLEPNFGSHSLTAGFEPDPYTMDIIAGGDRDASNLGAGCVGKISEAPDFRLTYEAGDYPLAFRTLSNQDTTLVINGPDGRWSCDDDSWGDGDAEVSYGSPQSGVYDIWVGTYGDEPAEAQLLVTEVP